MSEEEENVEQEQETQALIPSIQDTIIFHGKPLIVVRLPDGRPGVVLRWICENLHLAPGPQVLRIKRTEVIADDLVYVQVQTEGGFQTMPTLVLDSAPYWLATIDTRRMDRDDPNRLEILHYQKRAVAALFAWASTPKAIAAPPDVVPSEPVIQPARPGPEATLAEWHEYHLRMAALIEWQIDVEHWHGGIEGRLEGLEAIIPDILERLPPPTLSPEHQSQIKAFVHQLHEASGKPYGTLWNELKTAFTVAKYEQIPDEEWTKVANWFRVQLQRVKRQQ